MDTEQTAPVPRKGPPKPKRRPTSELTVPTSVELIGDGRYMVRSRCWSWANFIFTFALELVEGGVFVECLCPPVLGSIVELRLGLPDGARDLAVEGEVVTVREPAEAFATGEGPGFGMQVRLNPQHRTQLQRVIDRAQSETVASDLPTGDASASSSCLRLFVPQEEMRFVAELKQELTEIRRTDDRIRLGLPEEFDSEMVYLAFYARTQHWKSKAQSMVSPEIPGLVEAIVDILQQACARISAVADLGAARAKAPTPPPPPQPAATPSIPTVVAGPPAARSRRVPVVVAEAPAIPPSVPIAVSEPPAARPAKARSKSAPSRLSKQTLQNTWAQVSAPKGAVPPPLRPQPRQEVAAEKAQGDPALDPMTVVKEYLRVRRYGEAAATLRKALQAAPNSTRARAWTIWIAFIEARQLAATKDYTAAVAKYEEVLDLDPNHPAAQREVLMARCMLK